MKTIIQEAGGTINTHPSSKTSYVVVGKDPGNKLKKAEKYSIPQLSEQQLMELLGLDLCLRNLLAFEGFVAKFCSLQRNIEFHVSSLSKPAET